MASFSRLKRRDDYAPVSPANVTHVLYGEQKNVMKINPSPNANLQLEAGQSNLTLLEQRDLERIESTIAAKLAAFFEVAHALVQIKQRKLYRAEFQTFEEYCRKRWEFNRAHAYRLIAAAEVYETLSPMGDIPLPQNERQVRALEGLPSKTVKKAWRTAYEKAGKHGRITGALVQKAVSEVMEGRKDSNHEVFRTNWQIHVTSLLKEALELTRKGDQDSVADKIDRIALLLMVGRRAGSESAAN